MRKPTICICENKGADQLRSNCEADERLYVFATRIVQFVFYLYPKFEASSCFLCLYKSVCVGPVRKPHCYTPGIYADGYIAFAFPFVRSYVS